MPRKYCQLFVVHDIYKQRLRDDNPSAVARLIPQGIFVTRLANQEHRTHDLFQGVFDVPRAERALEAALGDKEGVLRAVVAGVNRRGSDVNIRRANAAVSSANRPGWSRVCTWKVE